MTQIRWRQPAFGSRNLAAVELTALLGMRELIVDVCAVCSNKFLRLILATPQVLRRGLGWIAIVMGTLSLSACGKTIEFTEEVQLPSSNEKIIVKRREVFEPRITGLQTRQTYIRSELSIVGTKLPTWKENLHPIYLDQVPDKTGYLLVTTIPGSIACYERGRPNSIYVTFIGSERGWQETEIAKSLDGREANLLLRVEGEDLRKVPISIERKQEINRTTYVGSNEKKIEVYSRFGC